MMKLHLLPALLLICIEALTQSSITTGNTCFESKAYQCAVDNYKNAIAEKSYQQQDYANILYRIGFSLGEIQKTEEGISYLKDAVTNGADFGSVYWALGGAYYNLKKYQPGIENYSLAIEKYKTDGASLKVLYYWRGRCYSQSSKYSEALADFKNAIAIDSNSASYQVNAGDMAYNLKKYEDAITYYQASIRLGDTAKKIMSARYYWLGESYLKLKRYEEAIASFRGAIQYNPPSPDALWGIAGAYYEQAKWQEALPAYIATLNEFKNDTGSTKRLLYYRGRSYSGLKDYTKAIADFESALKIDPQYRSAQWQLAYNYYLQKKYKEAIPAYNIALEMFKNSTLDLDDLTYYRGYCYLQLKDTVKAKTDLLQAISHNSALADPHLYLGHISFAEKKYYEAKDYYTRALPAFKTDSTHLSLIYFRRGYSYITMGTTYLSTAKSDLMQSILYDSTNKEAHRYLGDIYYQQSNFPMAEMEMEKCIRLFSSVKDSLARMYLYRGMARSQQSKFKETLSDYEQSDNLKKFADAESIKVMGQLAFEIKEYNKAIAIFDRLMPMYKQDQKNDLMFVYYARGRSALELKKKAPAVADLTKALELSPGNQEINSFLIKAKAL